MANKKKPVKVAKPRTTTVKPLTLGPAVPKPTKGHIVVLGGGPAGLGAALKLQENGFRVTLVEAKSFAGGAGATQKLHGCLVDYGPHLFHPTTTEITDVMKEYSAGEYFEAEMINKLILKGKTFTYPFKMQEALTKLNPVLNARIVMDYGWTKTKQTFRPQPVKTFEDWGRQSFGGTLYEMCFGSYTARVWGRHPSTISARLAKEKLSALSLRKILKNFVTRNAQTEGYLGVRMFGYHKDGIGAIYRNMAATIERRGGTVLYGTSLDTIEHSAGRVASVTVRTGAKRTKLVCDAVVSTVPLTQLYESLAVEPKAMTHARALEYRDILFVNFVIKRDQYSSAHMIYLLDTHFTSNRMAEQKNATARAAADGKTVLTFEIPCQRGDGLWNNEEKIYSVARADLAKLGVGPREIEKQFILRYVNAYPVFSVGYEVHLAAVKERLAAFENLLVAGRQGLYLNIDMHDSIRLGRLAADHLAEHSSGKGWMPKVNEFLTTLKL